MTASQQKIVQYLSEAQASEHALVRVLQSQIAITPHGAYRTALDTHLKETERHADRLRDRLKELGAGSNPVAMAIGLWEDMIGQGIALTKTPFDLLRGSGGEEKVLKNAKDTCAGEALEIATYTALERLARAVGDTRTAELAVSIRADEERMLDRVLRAIPGLADAVVSADVDGDGTYDITTTGAGEAVQQAADDTRAAARRATAATRRTARRARKVPGVAQVEGQVKGAVASEGDLAIARYDDLTADEIIGRLPGLSQIDLAKIDSYERRHENRTTILGRITTLRGEEPWPGYDELNASEVHAALSAGDEELARTVRTYERSHKNRAGVLRDAERELTHA